MGELASDDPGLLIGGSRDRLGGVTDPGLVRRGIVEQVRLGEKAVEDALHGSLLEVLGRSGPDHVPDATPPT